MDVLSDINVKDGITVLVSLHQVEYARRYCRRTIAMRDGAIVYDGPLDRAFQQLPGRALRRRLEELVLPDGPADLSALPRRTEAAAAGADPGLRPTTPPETKMNAILKSMAAMSVALTLSSAALAEETLNFGIISTESQQNLKTSWQPLLDDMKAKTASM